MAAASSVGGGLGRAGFLLGAGEREARRDEPEGAEARAGGGGSGGGGGGGGGSRRPPAGLAAARPLAGEARAGGGLGRGWARRQERSPKPAAWHPDADPGCCCRGAGPCTHRGPHCQQRLHLAPGRGRAVPGLELLAPGSPVCPWRSESRVPGEWDGMGLAMLDLNSVQGRLDSHVKFKGSALLEPLAKPLSPRCRLSRWCFRSLMSAICSLSFFFFLLCS